MKNFNDYLRIIQERTTFVPGSGEIPEENITTIDELDDYVRKIDGSAIEHSEPDGNQYLISLGETDEVLILIEYPGTTEELIKEVLYHKSLNFLLKYSIMWGVEYLSDYVQRMNGSKIMQSSKNKDKQEYQIYTPKKLGGNKAQLFSIKYPKDFSTLVAEIKESQSLNFLLKYRINRNIIDELNIYLHYTNGSTIEQNDPHDPNIYIVGPSELEGTDDDLFRAKYDKGINELIREVVSKGSLMFLLKYKINDKNESLREQTKFDKIELNRAQKNKALFNLEKLIPFSEKNSDFVTRVDININENPIEIRILTNFGEQGIDHGGGEDGEEWMDDEELKKYKIMYFNRFKRLYSSEFKTLKQKFDATEKYSDFEKQNSTFSSHISLDYEESGAVSIILKIKPTSLKSLVDIN